MMRARFHGDAGDAAAREPADGAEARSGSGSPIRVLALSHGPFDEVSRLNPAFLPGTPRVKLTLRIAADGDRPEARSLVQALSAILPSLSRHRCCGDNSIGGTFFARSHRRGCGAPVAEDGVDLAHLVEHVAIDSLHFVARMKRCSGVTCAWSSPTDVYDVYVESPEEALGRAFAAIAVDVVNELLRGARSDPVWPCVLEVARTARDHAGWPVAPRLATPRARWGSTLVDRAVDLLRRRGLLEECHASFNFSGGVMLAYVPAMPPHALGS